MFRQDSKWCDWFECLYSIYVMYHLLHQGFGYDVMKIEDFILFYLRKTKKKRLTKEVLKDAYVDIIPETKLASSFCKLMNINKLTDECLIGVEREQLLKRMAKNTVNLYVTFTECSPMIPLESFELGVPCVIGNNTDFFKNSKLNEMVVVKEEDSIDEIYEKINFAIEKKDEIMELYRQWKKEYSKEVIRLKEEFLNK